MQKISSHTRTELVTPELHYYFAFPIKLSRKYTILLFITLLCFLKIDLLGLLELQGSFSIVPIYFSGLTTTEPIEPLGIPLILHATCRLGVVGS
jgi:hypothetical protein